MDETELRAAAREVLRACQRFLDQDDLDGLRDALTELEDALARHDQRTLFDEDVKT